MYNLTEQFNSISEYRPKHNLSRVIHYGGAILALGGFIETLAFGTHLINDAFDHHHAIHDVESLAVWGAALGIGLGAAGPGAHLVDQHIDNHRHDTPAHLT